MDRIVIFSEIYDFCKQFEVTMVKKRDAVECIREKRLHVSEIITIQVYFSFSGYKNFKEYYTKQVSCSMRDEFPNAPSYTRFIEIKQEYAEFFGLFLVSKIKQSERVRIGYVDSFPLKVCNIKRELSHKTCKLIAAKGKTTLGWFYGFKLHLIISPFGDILSCSLTPGNIADNNENLLDTLTKYISGTLFGDKGYLLNGETYEKLFNHGVKFVTRIRSNMNKKPLYLLHEKLLLKKRGLIESVGNVLKNVLSIEHSRHRSILLSSFMSSLV
jgi:hypothetical protein